MRTAEDTNNARVPNIEIISKHLSRREKLQIGRIFLLLLLSAPGTLFDAFFLSGIVWLIGPLQHHVPWRPVFYWCIPGAILIFWCIDRLTPESNSEIDPTSSDTNPTTAGGHYAMSPWTIGADESNRHSMPVFTEIVLMGPRILRNALQKIRGVWAVGFSNRNRAAQMVRDLLTSDHAVEVESFLKPPERLESIMSAVAYLLFYGWIDSSHDGRRIWLSETSRTYLHQLAGG
jgi:hypothetical protein